MAAIASTSSTGVRYAPEDPTLPKPWKGLVDGKTGFLYFWNPKTNVTQYEKPVASSDPPTPSAPPKPTSVSVSSSVQVHQSSLGHQNRDSINREDIRYNVGRNHQSIISGSDHLHDVSNGSTSAQTLRSAAREHGSSMGSGSSVDSYCRQHEITVSGDNVPPPFTSFESTGFPLEILREVRSAGFTAPTPIQAQSWPIVLQNRDIVAIAKTGSGKTLGYLIPGFVHLTRRRNNSKMGPTVLVLSPTRELATQIQDEAVKFSRTSRISCTCLYGGAPKGPQLRDLDRGVDIVVATPGRLNDILEMRRINLQQVSYLVLDEADRMLDMGFEPQIRKIVNEIPARRQTLMFTATWPKEVRKIAADLLTNPTQVNIGNIDELVANKSITQYVEVVTSMEKQKRVDQILRSQEPGSKVIIFCSTKKMCDQLARTLTRPFGAAAIHGDKSQGERDHVLNQFRTGKSPILVATDVAARGLDIKDIRVVINYDFPTGIEDYVHRIGRTGRAGATGVAYTFFCDQNAKHANDLIKVLEGANQQVPPEIRDMARGGGGMGRSRRPWDSGYGGFGDSSGRNDSSYGGRGGGRSFHESFGRSDRGHGGRGYDQSRDSGRGYNQSYRSEQNEEACGRFDSGYPASNSDHRVGDWGQGQSRSRSRSRSPERHGGVQHWGRSPIQRRDDDGVANGKPSPSRGEEEEEGIIQEDEEGMTLADKDGGGWNSNPSGGGT